MFGRVTGLCAAALLWVGGTSQPEIPPQIGAIIGDSVPEGIEAVDVDAAIAELAAFYMSERNIG